MSTVQQTWAHYQLEMRDELPVGHADVRYDRAHAFAQSEEVSSIHGIVCREAERIVASCTVAAGGGASGVHEHSLVVVGDVCFVAVGDLAVALHLPSLDVVWSRAVDHATCFGLLTVVDGSGLIAHGELEIVRLTLGGDIVCSAGGADIFSEGLAIVGDVVVTTDFNGREYRFDLATGFERARLRTPP